MNYEEHNAGDTWKVHNTYLALVKIKSILVVLLLDAIITFR